MSFQFRSVSLEDCERVWKWINEPEVRAVAFQSEPLDWEHHREWFERRLSKGVYPYWIIVDSEKVLGQVRFDQKKEKDQVCISIVLSAEARDKGSGSKILRDAADKFFSEFPNLNDIYAWIKQSNIRSVRAFQSAGFTLLEETTISGQPAIILKKNRKN